jgi:hypothetical protein
MGVPDCKASRIAKPDSNMDVLNQAHSRIGTWVSCIRHMDVLDQLDQAQPRALTGRLPWVT